LIGTVRELMNILGEYHEDTKLSLKVGDADSDETESDGLYINSHDGTDEELILELEMRLPDGLYISEDRYINRKQADDYAQKLIEENDTLSKNIGPVSLFAVRLIDEIMEAKQ